MADPRTSTGSLDEDEESNAAIGGGYDDLLAKFYGVQVDSPDAAGPAEDASASQGLKTNASPKPPPPKTKIKSRTNLTNLDSEDFDPDHYVNHVLKKQGIQGLLEEEATIKNQVRNLESDMQMLVYENYNKFISATDMIRKMKTNVESMEQEMKRLTDKMSSISTKCEHLEGSLEANRNKMENLVGVNRLLQRLQFLFELPHRLQKSIQSKSYAQAVRYYKISHKILHRYKTITSFSKISSDSASIIGRLSNILKGILNDPTQKPLHKMETASLLLELKEPPQELWKALFKSMEQKLQTLVFSVASETTVSAQLNALGKGFIASYTSFANLFIETFGNRMGADEALNGFTKRIFKQYFTTVTKIFDREAKIPLGQDAHKAAETFMSSLAILCRQVSKPSSLASEAKLVDTAAEIIERKIRLFVDALMENTIDRLAKHVKDAYMCSARLSREKNLGAHLKDLDQSHRKEEIAKDSKEKDTSEDEHEKNAETTENGEGDDGILVTTIEAVKLAAIVRELVEENIDVLMLVLDVHSYLPSGLFIGLSFSNLAKAHMIHLMQKVMETLQIGCSVSQGGAGQEYIFTVPGSSPLQEAVPGFRGREVPIFLLYLSQVCRNLHAEYASAIWQYLETKSSEKTKSKVQRELPNILAKFRAIADRLLLEYVKVRGLECIRLIPPVGDMKATAEIIPLDRDSRDPQRIKPSAYTKDVAKLLHKIREELDFFFKYNKAKEEKASSVKGLHSNRAGGGTRMLRLSSDEKHLNRNIERMFRERVPVVESIHSNTTSPLRAIMQMFAKAYGEELRGQVLSLGECLLVQLDLSCIHVHSAKLIAGQSTNNFDALVEEAITIAGDRLRQELDPHIGWKTKTIVSIYETHLKDVTPVAANPLS